MKREKGWRQQWERIRNSRTGAVCFVEIVRTRLKLETDPRWIQWLWSQDLVSAIISPLKVVGAMHPHTAAPPAVSLWGQKGKQVKADQGLKGKEIELKKMGVTPRMKMTRRVRWENRKRERKSWPQRRLWTFKPLRKKELPRGRGIPVVSVWVASGSRGQGHRSGGSGQGAMKWTL